MIRARTKARLAEVKKTTIVCIGIAPSSGCGAVLTAAERRHSGEACEYCELDFQDRIRAWRFGRADPELDEVFGPAA